MTLSLAMLRLLNGHFFLLIAAKARMMAFN